MPSRIHYINSIPNRFTSNANNPKQIRVITTETARVGQKPMRGNNHGNTRNMGKVGTAYQKVYQAWLAIFSVDWFSTWSQMSTRIVTMGKAAAKAPSLSLRLATSVISTTMAAVIRYLVIIQDIAFSHCVGRKNCHAGFIRHGNAVNARQSYCRFLNSPVKLASHTAPSSDEMSTYNVFSSASLVAATI